MRQQVYIQQHFRRGNARLYQALRHAVAVKVQDRQRILNSQTYFCALLESGRKADARAYWTAVTAGKTLVAAGPALVRPRRINRRLACAHPSRTRWRAGRRR